MTHLDTRRIIAMALSLLALHAIGSVPRAGAQAARARIDSTQAVAPNGRVNVSNRVGAITIHAWDRAHVRVRVDVPTGDSLKFISGNGITEVVRVAREPSADVAMELWIPRGAALEVFGLEGPITVEGGAVSTKVLSGRGLVRVVGGRGPVSINSSSGDIEVRGIEGSLALSSSAGNIRVSSSAGTIEATSNAGSVELTDLRAERVTARSLRGDVTFGGRLLASSTVSLESHSGAVVATLHADSDVTVRARSTTSTISSLLRVAGVVRGGVNEFVLGRGTATVSITTFSGPISLRVAERP